MYILGKDIDHLEYEAFKVKANEYREYLASIKDQLNLHPMGFVFEDWYRSSKSHKCPHDSGLINWLCRKMTIMKFKLR